MRPASNVRARAAAPLVGAIVALGAALAVGLAAEGRVRSVIGSCERGVGGSRGAACIDASGAVVACP